MGMGADWDRVLSYIPPSRLATAEQQQRLLSMQMSMMMGVKTMQSRQRADNTTQQPRQLAPQQYNGRQPVKEEKLEEQKDEDEDEEEVDDSELLDEEGDGHEIRAMKAELRQLRAEKTAASSAAAKTTATVPTNAQPPLPRSQPALTQPTNSDLVALVDRLTVATSMDDPD